MNWLPPIFFFLIDEGPSILKQGLIQKTATVVFLFLSSINIFWFLAT